MRFMSNNLLTQEESQHKDEIINLTEQVLDAKGLKCVERVQMVKVAITKKSYSMLDR